MKSLSINFNCEQSKFFTFGFRCLFYILFRQLCMHCLRNVQTVFDDLEGEEMRRARTRSNPYETIRGGIFLNRSVFQELLPVGEMNNVHNLTIEFCYLGVIKYLSVCLEVEV